MKIPIVWSKLITLFFLLCTTTSANHKVYLIHGFGSNTLFMKSIDKYLKKNGMQTENFGYPSLREDLTVSAESLYVHIKASKIDTVSFVTHSMGALVLRAATNFFKGDSTFPVVHRIVMVTPPNQGAEIADFFASSKVWRYILGSNIQNLATDTASLAHKLPVPKEYEIGIIIGIRKGKKGYNPFIKGNNDGYLTPEAARLGTEKESIFVSAQHSMIIHNKKALRLILLFLRKGTFSADAL